MAGWDRAWKWGLAHPRLALIILSLLVLIPGLFTLPPLDRDEARFAQATKQMLETGDFVEIRFQDEARNKKPVGLYWLQAVSAALMTDPPHDRIWAYRIPSILGAIFAVLLTFAIGRHLFDPAIALLGAALLAVSVGLVTEGHIAKTDAVLLGTILTSQWAFAHVYLGRRKLVPLANRAGREKPTPAPWHLVAVFWLGLGAGLLVKGPVAPFVVGATAITLALWDRDWRLLTSLRPLIGVVFTSLVVLPWGIAIWIATDGQFFRDALLGDFGDKLIEGKERHGGWPGSYLALVVVTLWPAVIALAPALVEAWRDRDQAPIRFLIAWVVPAWVIFELIPTKLPHYVLPLYPALALACAATLLRLERGESPFTRHWTTWASVIVFALVSLALAASLVVLPTVYGTGADAVSNIAALALVAVILVVLLQAERRRFLGAAVGSLIVAFLFYLALFQLVVPRLDRLQVSPRAAELVASIREGLGKSEVAATGYAEPSLVFLTGTETQLGTVHETVAFLAADPRRLALIEGRFEKDFHEAIAAQGLRAAELGAVEGVNYSKGQRILLKLYAVEQRQP